MADVKTVAESVLKIADNSIALDRAIITLCESLVNKVTQLEAKTEILERRLDAMLHLYYDRFDKDSTVI